MMATSIDNDIRLLEKNALKDTRFSIPAYQSIGEAF